MVRVLMFLLGLVTANRPGQRSAAWYGPQYAPASAGSGTDTAPYPPGYGPDRSAGNGRLPPADLGPAAGPPGALAPRLEPPPRRPRIPRLVAWSVVVLVIGLIFRRAIAAVVLMALSAAFHLIGVNVHLPHVRFAWPWQTISAGTTTNTDLGTPPHRRAGRTPYRTRRDTARTGPPVPAGCRRPRLVRPLARPHR